MKKVTMLFVCVFIVCASAFAADTDEKHGNLYVDSGLNVSGLAFSFGMENQALGFDVGVSEPLIAVIASQSPKGLLDPLLWVDGYWRLGRGKGFNLNLGLSGYVYCQFDNAETSKLCLFWGPSLDIAFRFKGGHSFFISGTLPMASVLSAIDERIGGESNLAEWSYAVIDLSGNGTDVGDVFSFSFLALIPAMARIGYRFYF